MSETKLVTLALSPRLAVLLGHLIEVEIFDETLPDHAVTALEAVLAEIERQGVSIDYNASAWQTPGGESLAAEAAAMPVVDVAERIADKMAKAANAAVSEEV